MLRVTKGCAHVNPTIIMQKLGGLPLLLAIVLFAINRGCSMLGTEPSWIYGSLWFLTAIVIAVADIWIWQATSWLEWPYKIAISEIIVLLAVGFSYQPILDQYAREHAPPKPPISNQDDRLAEQLKGLRNELEATKKRRAYVRIEPPTVRNQIGSPLRVGIACHTLPGVPALQAGCWLKFGTRTLVNGKLPDATANELYRLFEAEIEPDIKRRTGKLPSIEPDKAILGFSNGPIFDEKLQKALEGDDVILIVVLLIFSDEAGPHRTEGCFWLEPPLSNPEHMWHVCGVHNGIRF
jgi:hypothetical protein